MSIDWSQLKNRTSGFVTMDVTKDPAGKVVDVLYVGLHVAMSELVAHFPPAGGSTLTIFVDTLVMDTGSLPTRGTVIVARVIDVSAMARGDGQLTVSPPASGTSVVEILAGKVLGGSLSLAGPGGARPMSIPDGLALLRAALFIINASGEVKTQVISTIEDIGDLTGRIYALNSFRASFSAATWLMNSDGDDARSAAREMLAWVVACTVVPVRGMATNPGAWSELYAQATPLLLGLNVESGTTYVPSLSSSFYKTEVSILLDSLDRYSGQILSLQNARNLQQAIDDVGGGLSAVATTDLPPLDRQLDTLRQNLGDLSVGINSLNLQFALQSSTVDVRWAQLLIAITEEQIQAWFRACFSLAMSAVKIAFDGAKLIGSGGADISAAKGIITESLTAAKTAYEAIDKVAKKPGKGQAPLLEKARKLVEMQQKLTESYALSIGLASDVGASASPSLFAIDPAVAWDNYMAEAKTQLGSMNLGAAGSYLLSLTLLANYGKAMAVKIATATSQRAQYCIVQSQRSAAEQAGARWQELESRAISEQEKLAALMGVLQSRADANRRSVYVAWSHYRDSYFYLYFEKPPISVNLDMSTAALRSAFAKAALWVGQVLGDDPSGERVRLPNTSVKVQFEFDVCTLDSDKTPVNSALFIPASGDIPATLTWAIPLGTDQLEGVLPNRGDVAIWINDATFYVDGATPNDKGNIIAQVSTSGTYENGFGPARSHEFVAKSMVGSYGYKMGSSKPPYDPWSIDTEVYMTPTPYTQWTMAFDPDGGDASTASKLRMQLSVSYRKPT